MIIVQLKSKEPGTSHHMRDARENLLIERGLICCLPTHKFPVPVHKEQRLKRNGLTQLVDHQGELAGRITTDKDRQSIANVPIMSGSKSTAGDCLLIA